MYMSDTSENVGKTLGQCLSELWASGKIIHSVREEDYVTFHWSSVSDFTKTCLKESCNQVCLIQCLLKLFCNKEML